VAFGVVVALLIAILVAVLVDDTNSSNSASGSLCSATPVANTVMPSVVTIQVNGAGGAGTGSGEFLDTNGDVLTNNHVIASAASGGTIGVVLSNGDRAGATLVGRDRLTDLAVIKADVTADQSKPIVFDTSGDLKIGEQVFSVGAPLGLSNTISAGIVSSLGRTVRVPAENGTTALLESAIQTDASINPGNSGGTLADCAGKLVGVPTAGATASDSTGGQVAGSIGLGFAISAETAKTVADEIIAHGSVTHSYTGLAVTTVSRSASPTAPRALYVTAVSPGSPAASAGIQAGDVITEIDGKPTSSADQIETLALTHKPGDAVKLAVERSGQTSTVSLTLAAQPGQ
jgi:putative serine protease PepD